MVKRFALATAHAHLSSCQPRRGGRGRQCGSVFTIASRLGIGVDFWLLKPGPFASFLPVVVQIQTIIVLASGCGSPQDTWRWEATSSRDRASGLRPTPRCGLFNLALPGSLTRRPVTGRAAACISATNHQGAGEVPGLSPGLQISLSEGPEDSYG